jgi:hypothetical protein
MKRRFHGAAEWLARGAAVGGLALVLGGEPTPPAANQAPARVVLGYLAAWFNRAEIDVPDFCRMGELWHVLVDRPKHGAADGGGQHSG